MSIDMYGEGFLDHISDDIAAAEAVLKGLRFNKGKTSITQIPPEPIIAVAKVFDKSQEATDQYPNGKYPRNNWRKGLPWVEGILDSMIRHQYAFLNGENFDPESGLPHTSHILANAVMLSTYFETGTGTDDRFILDETTIEYGSRTVRAAKSTD